MNADDDASRSRDAELLERYAVSGPSALQDADVAAVVAAHPRLVAELESGLARLRLGLQPDDDVHSFAKNIHRPVSPTAATRVAPRTWPFISTSRPLTRAVVATTLGILATITLLSVVGRESVPRVSHTYTTNAGERATVTLTDGSRAILGPSTRLTIAMSRSSGTEALLDGEAQFMIVQNESRSFSVRTRESVTRVLGTMFAVRRYGTDAVTRVTVSDGRVGVRNAIGRTSQETVLDARAIAIVTDSGSINVQRNTDVSDYTAWTTGRLVFTDVPVSKIMTELQRAYGANVTVRDTELAAQKVSCTIPVGTLSLPRALDALANILDAHVTRSNGQLLLVPGRSPSRNEKLSKPILTSEPQYGR
jgi:transmembrane sensor